MKIAKNQHSKKLDGSGLKIAIVFSRFNKKIGEILLSNTVDSLTGSNVDPNNISILKVPGALEIPLAAKRLLEQKKYDALIALGIVLKGETYHFEIVSNESHRALMDLNMKYGIPVIFGIICAKDVKQARDRAKKESLDKGREFAETALEMALLFKRKNLIK